MLPKRIQMHKTNYTICERNSLKPCFFSVSGFFVYTEVLFHGKGEMNARDIVCVSFEAYAQRAAYTHEKSLSVS